MPLDASPRDVRLLTEAEGYLALEMLDHALRSLGEISEPRRIPFEFHYLKGQIYRTQERHSLALEEFEQALTARPDNVSLLLAMAWCYKRTAQLSRAITSTEQAYRLQPRDALILYNLSCYWSLAGNKNQALSWLGRALRIDRTFHGLIADETDFDPVRGDPDFQKLLQFFGGESSTDE